MEMVLPALYVLALTSVSNALLYDDHTFGIDPNNSTFVLENDSGWIPHYQENYVVQNIGRNPVDAQLWYGDELQWFGIVCGATVFPGELKILNNEGKIYYVTGLKIINNNGTRAIIHADGGELPTPYIPSIYFDPYRLLRTTLSFSIKYLSDSIIGEIFTILLDEFWPEKHLNIWSEVAEKVKSLLLQTEVEIIDAILENQLRVISTQIKSLNNELYNNLSVRQHYMHIAYSLLGFEENFRFTPTIKNYTNVNFCILPLYTNFVSMKMNFYLLGIRNQIKINLTAEDVQTISGYANNTFVNASKYIQSISKYAVDYAYNISDAQGIFDSMMTVRSHLAIHGEEYLPIWQYQLKNPFSKKKVNNNVMVFSNYFGKPTANLFAQATPVNVPAPLSPKLIDGVRDRLIKIKIFLNLRTALESTISGVNLFFQSGKKYQLGFKTLFTKEMKLVGIDILKLTAFGENKIDGLKFYLSDTTIQSFGTVTSTTFKEFELPNHRISSMYLSGDESIGQALNIAVSYQWNDF